MKAPAVKPLSRLSWRNRSNTMLLSELAAIITLLAGFFIELRHIVSTTWLPFFLNNSDIITLPLVGQSITHHEPFQWVFSSQIFLFPEGLLYGFSSLITPNFRLALIVNSFINCLLFYILLRLICRNYVHDSRLIQLLYGLVATLYILFLTVLEPLNSPYIATYFLVTTAYYGVILSALASLAIITTFVKNRLTTARLEKSDLFLYIGLPFIISLLTSSSNPLYIFQFVAPLVVVVALAWLVTRLHWKKLVLLLAPVLGGSLAGIVARDVLFKKFFSPLGNVNSYIHLDQIGNALRSVKALVTNMLQGGWPLRLELSLITLGLIGSFWILISTAIKILKSRSHSSSASQTTDLNQLLITGFATLAPIMVVIGGILVGNAITRYFIPVVLFPLLAFIPLLNSRQLHPLRIAKHAGVLLVALTILGLISTGLSKPASSVRLVSSYYNSDQSCLDKSVAGGSYRAGIAQYWRARGLQLNSRQDIQVEQVLGNLNKFTWLYNRADYTLYHPDFVVVDKLDPAFMDSNVSLSPNFAIFPNAAKGLLGEPSKISTCPSFDVYLYPPSNPGNKILNTELRDPRLGL